MDECGDMSRRGKTLTEGASPDDTELFARLSRLRSELTQSKRALADRALLDGRLDEVETKLREAEELAESTTDRNSDAVDDLKDKCLLVVHEVEAELCMLKPAALLYPTWTRLRENLYRFDEEQREAWKADIASRIQADDDEPPSDTLRQRLRQLTLELHESAARYNRLVGERAEVTREVIKLGVMFLCGFVALTAACVTLATWPVTAAGTTLVSLVAGVVSGGMGAVFSRLRTLRDERTRRQFEDILKWDMGLRACIGSGAALFVVAVLLSDFLAVLQLPDDITARVALLVVFGFGAGFSDRLFNVMLSKVLGTSASHSPRDRG